MPYWVEQTKGQHTDDIKAIVSHYKHANLDAQDAWCKLAALYSEIRPDREPPNYDDHASGKGSSVEYMLTTWFPLYANMWFSESFESCKHERDRLNHTRPNDRFEIFYEY